MTSVREALNALDYLSDRRTSKLFAKMHDTVRWKVVVNGKELNGASPTVAARRNVTSRSGGVSLSKNPVAPALSAS